jgi:hypothetical protein
MKPWINMDVKRFLFFSIIIVCSLFGCGGGGSGGGDDSGGTVNTPTYAIGGTISGLNGLLELRLNNTVDISIGSDGAFVFPTRFNAGTNFSVSIKAQPSVQVCSLSLVSGTVAENSKNVLAIQCVDSLNIDLSKTYQSGEILEIQHPTDLTESISITFSSGQVINGAAINTQHAIFILPLLTETTELVKIEVGNYTREFELKTQPASYVANSKDYINGFISEVTQALEHDLQASTNPSERFQLQTALDEINKNTVDLSTYSESDLQLFAQWIIQFKTSANSELVAQQGLQYSSDALGKSNMDPICPAVPNFLNRSVKTIYAVSFFVGSIYFAPVSGPFTLLVAPMSLFSGLFLIDSIRETKVAIVEVLEQCFAPKEFIAEILEPLDPFNILLMQSKGMAYQATAKLNSEDPLVFIAEKKREIKFSLVSDLSDEAKSGIANVHGFLFGIVNSLPSFAREPMSALLLLLAPQPEKMTMPEQFQIDIADAESDITYELSFLADGVAELSFTPIKKQASGQLMADYPFVLTLIEVESELTQQLNAVLKPAVPQVVNLEFSTILNQPIFAIINVAYSETLELITAPERGRIEMGVSHFEYTPPVDFYGVVTFSYRAINSTGSSLAALITINIYNSRCLTLPNVDKETLLDEHSTEYTKSLYDGQVIQTFSPKQNDDGQWIGVLEKQRRFPLLSTDFIDETYEPFSDGECWLSVKNSEIDYYENGHTRSIRNYVALEHPSQGWYAAQTGQAITYENDYSEKRTETNYEVMEFGDGWYAGFENGESIQYGENGFKLLEQTILTLVFTNNWQRFIVGDIIQYQPDSELVSSSQHKVMKQNTDGSWVSLFDGEQLIYFPGTATIHSRTWTEVLLSSAGKWLEVHSGVDHTYYEDGTVQSISFYAPYEYTATDGSTVITGFQEDFAYTFTSDGNSQSKTFYVVKKIDGGYQSVQEGKQVFYHSNEVPEREFNLTAKLNPNGQWQSHIEGADIHYTNIRNQILSQENYVLRQNSDLTWASLREGTQLFYHDNEKLSYDFYLVVKLQPSGSWQSLKDGVVISYHSSNGNVNDIDNFVVRQNTDLTWVSLQEGDSFKYFDSGTLKHEGSHAIKENEDRQLQSYLHGVQVSYTGSGEIDTRDTYEWGVLTEHCWNISSRFYCE